MESIDTNIKVIRNKLFPSNTYLLYGKNNTCLIIDPGLDYRAISSGIKDSSRKPIAVLSTHGHFDHMGSAANIQTDYNIPYYLHSADLKMSQSANFFLKVAGIDYKITTPKPDVLIKGKHETLNIEEFKIDVHNYPGHSAGSCVFKIDSFLFTGDLIYKQGLGPESMPREDKKLLKTSILELFSIFKDNSLVLPGHGPSEYLGNIKQNNIELKDFLKNWNDAN